MKHISANGLGELFSGHHILKLLSEWKPVSEPSEVSVSLETNEEKVVIDGVCDAINENIESVDAAGFPILHTDEVIMKAKTILASTRWAYDDLKDMGLKADVYDMQRFMPLG